MILFGWNLDLSLNAIRIFMENIRMIICTNCNVGNHENDAKHCWYCGKNVIKVPDKCECGYHINTNHIHCPNCGIDLNKLKYKWCKERGEY